MLLQQNTVAHYRARLYECLTEQAGIDLELVADPTSDTPYLATATEAGTTVAFTPSAVWKLRLFRLPDIYFQPGALKRLLLGEFDVAIALGSPYSLTTWLMLLMGPLLGTRVLLWTHGLLAPEAGPKWWLRSLLYRCSAGLLLYAERGRQLLLAQGFDRPMFVVNNSLDPEAQARAEAALTTERLASLRQRLDLRESDRVLIFIGRLQPVKRLDLLVRAAGILGARGLRVHVVLLGEGAERETLSRLATAHGVSELVHFEGAKYDEGEIAAYFALSDLCVIPSGAGLTVLHALGYGTPVLTHDRPELQFPEIEAILPGRTGALYTEGDQDSLVQAIDASLFPEPMKVRHADACRRRVALDYGPAAQAARMAEAARQVATAAP